MSRILIAVLCLALPQWLLAADRCKFERKLDRELDAAGLASLNIDARAGELGVKGNSPATVTVHAILCTDRERNLELMNVDVSRSGSEGRVAAIIPESVREGWDPDYAFIDLEVTVPRDLHLVVRDSSGDMTLRDVAVTSIEDSSGRIDIRGSHADLALSDSSGEIDIEDMHGNLTLTDSSGDIVLREITGIVRIERDSSGDIDIRDIKGNVVIDNDSSGSIDVDHVEGGVEIGRDGSGISTSAACAMTCASGATAAGKYG